MEYKLEQVQSQRLKLSPEQIQSIKILQCTATELNNLIGEELLSNPMLELAENQPVASIHNNNFNWEEHAKDVTYDKISNRIPKQMVDDPVYSYEDFVKYEISLSDYLHIQLNLVKADKKIIHIAEYIIDTLNDMGYRTERATEISNKFEYPYDKVQEAITLIQSFEPAGVAAKSIPECLKLQLERSGKYDGIFEKILFEHLDDLAANRLKVIAKDLNISIDTLVEYCNEIKSLNPKPGMKYGNEMNNKYILADLELREIDGQFIILQNEGIFPLINTSPYYGTLLKEAAGDKDTLDYLHKKMDSAVWFIKGIEQRRQTVQKIAEAIINRQNEFFRNEAFLLKPITLSDIAQDVKVHESTVSRAVNGKYIQTPRGLFELKYFFSTRINSAKGEDVSATMVKNQIKDIIKSEDPKKPFSDEKIKSLLLSNYGSDISRRTIAKYRMELNIPGTSKRKQY